MMNRDKFYASASLAPWKAASSTTTDEIKKLPPQSKLFIGGDFYRSMDAVEHSSWSKS